ncbi:MAG: hypothetical protein ACREJO_06835 [Phycisphaerales bacterium]
MDLRRHQIDETELLAFIEREPLAVDRADAVRGAIAADAGLRELVDGMRADRSALAGIDDVHAPSNLLELVEARLEREALVGLSRVGAPAKLPVSQVIPERESVIGQIITRPWARQLAMAAGLLIVAGVGFMVVKANWPTHKAREFARGDNRAEPGTLVEKPEGLAAKTASGANPKNDADLAVGPTRSAATGSTTVEPTTVQGPAAIADASSKDAAKTEVQPPAMTLDRAIALAKEGRLVVRLRATDGNVAQERLDSLAKRAGSWLKHGPATPGEGIEIADAVQIAVAASRPAPANIPVRPTEDAMAGTPSASNSRPSLPTPANAVPPPSVNLAGQVYCLTLTPDDDNLRSLLQRLNGGDKDLLAQLQEVALPVAVGAPMTPDAMLWWNRAPVQWDRRLVVPVVVELP